MLAACLEYHRPPHETNLSNLAKLIQPDSAQPPPPRAAAAAAADGSAGREQAAVEGAV